MRLQESNLNLLPFASLCFWLFCIMKVNKTSLSLWLRQRSKPVSTQCLKRENSFLCGLIFDNSLALIKNLDYSTLIKPRHITFLKKEI